jgi:hypothetical protein
MEDQAREFVAGFREDECAHFGLLLALSLPVSAARIAMVSGAGRVGRQFFELLDG